MLRSVLFLPKKCSWFFTSKFGMLKVRENKISLRKLSGTAQWRTLSRSVPLVWEPIWRFGVLPSVDVACEESCRCMQRCWFPQALPTRQPSRCMSIVLTPD